MGDSDDEYDRRRRDKFRRERSDYERSRERDERRRDDWSDREWDRGRERRSRGDYRDYERSRRERFSPPPRHELSPPQKRLRRDWDEHGADPYHHHPPHSGYEGPYGGGGAGGGPTYGPPQPWGHPDVHVLQHHVLPIQARLGSLAEAEPGQAAPPVLKSFKEFLLALDDAVDETEAVRRYHDYKVDFRRQQMQDFFLAHKDEEWFRSKYHPDEAGRRRREARAALRNRRDVFLFLLERGWLDELLLDVERAPAIVKTLDAAVIKMEGGTDSDLRILEQEEEEERPERGAPPERRDDPRGPPERPPGADAKAEGEEPAEDKAQKGPAQGEEEEEKGRKEEEPDKEPKKGSPDPPHYVTTPPTASGHAPCRIDDNRNNNRNDNNDNNNHPRGRHRHGRGGGPRNRRGGDGGGGDSRPRPRALHRTCSLFMRNVAPNISHAEIAALCKRYPGFMRVALSEPQPERRFFRRGWVTFDRSVNIKEICWSLQNIRLRDCELSPGVNRDLTRRVRNVNGLTQHRAVVRNDIKLAAKLVHALDGRAQLWGADGDAPGAPDGDAPSAPDGDAAVSDAGLWGPGAAPSQNPVLKHITDYLIEEVSAEEEELLGRSGDAAEEAPRDNHPAEVTVERDEKLLKVLDKLLLYLRIVHSVDYYNACEYVNEDEMPNRCGIVHVRGPLPPNRVSHGEVAEWQKTFEERLSPLLSAREPLSDEDAQRMGRKDPELEVEKFVSANTQELGKDKEKGKDKWLCPLSGKKFKGPEFVRKHIFNKHADKVAEVRKEVAFFNNFLLDPKRPALPEGKGGPAPPPHGMSPGLPYPPQAPQGMMPYGQPRPPMLGYGGGPPYPAGPYGAGRGNYESFRGGGYGGKARSRLVRGDPRAIVEYRDLDAPDDVDFF
ncbi:serrate RNA effector molecule homolog [Eudromia elegans]